MGTSTKGATAILFAVHLRSTSLLVWPKKSAGRAEHLKPMASCLLLSCSIQIIEVSDLELQ